MKIWFTEFAAYREHDEEKVIQYIEELLPLLEHSDFIHRYSWFISRYYEVRREYFTVFISIKYFRTMMRVDGSGLIQ